MGTTTFSAYLRPYAQAGNRGFVVHVPIRALSGVYSGAGISSQRNLRGLKSFLPSINVPIDSAGNKMSPEWYTFFHYFVNVFTDLSSAVTLADVKQALVTEQAQAAYTAAMALSSSQQVMQNAQATAALREVVQTAALPGSTQVPPVQLVPAEPAYEWGTGARIADF